MTETPARLIAFREAVFREGRLHGLTVAASIVRTASSNAEAVRLIEAAMNGSPASEPILGASYERELTEGSGYSITGVGHHAEDD